MASTNGGRFHAHTEGRGALLVGHRVASTLILTPHALPAAELVPQSHLRATTSTTAAGTAASSTGSAAARYRGSTAPVPLQVWAGGDDGAALGAPFAMASQYGSASQRVVRTAAASKCRHRCTDRTT